MEFANMSEIITDKKLQGVPLKEMLKPEMQRQFRMPLHKSEC